MCHWQVRHQQEMNSSEAKDVTKRCRLCLSECSKPLSRICRCTHMAFGHSDCVQAFILMTGQLDCELCHQPFFVPQEVLKLEDSADQQAIKLYPKKDIYFFSSLIDIFIVLILLNILNSYEANLHGIFALLLSFLNIYAIVYLALKFVLPIVLSHIAKVYQYVMTDCEDEAQ